MSRCAWATAALTLTCCTPINLSALDAGADTRQTRDPSCAVQGGAVVQVLGSGGPMHGGGRGSAAYLIWYEGAPSVVVDMGGGTATALARAGVGAAQVDALLLSHLHPDHVSDLPEFLWGELVAERKHALAVVGPSEGNGFPATSQFLERQFGPTSAFPDMQVVLTGQEFKLDLHTVNVEDIRASLVWQRGGLRVTTYPVPHGRAPALAYRVDGPSFSVVFGGDQTGLDPGFSTFARNTDILVMHAMLTPRAVGHPLTKVVALPENIGKAAAEAGAKKVVLGHLMASTRTPSDTGLWSLSSPDSVLAAVRTAYNGDVSLASGLECFRP